MYKPTDKTQTSFLDFNQPMGLNMEPNNRWVQMADKVPWDVFEIKYAGLFPSGTGNVAKLLRMALGSLIIQKRFQFPDRELVEQITENPYLQYFIGLPGYQNTPPFDASTLVLFRKRITADMLNEAREKLEYMIYRICKSYGLQLPRRYCRRARKDYLAFAKSRKHTKKQIRTAIRKQLSYVHRDINYLEGYFSQGYAPDTRDIPLILAIIKLHEQQEYMYKNKVHSVPDRIVSISQPWIRPIVRSSCGNSLGKVKSPVEFGAKLDVSIDEKGYGRLEKVSYDAYNESGCLIGAVERYKTRTGHYPERVLADQIYRTRGNRAYCKKHGIRLSGPKLGRPSMDAKIDKKQEYKAQMRLDNTDRIEVERYFSRNKRCYGMGCIVTKLEETQLTSIALSVFVSSLFKIRKRILLAFIWLCYKCMVLGRQYKLKVA